MSQILPNQITSKTFFHEWPAYPRKSAFRRAGTEVEAPRPERFGEGLVVTLELSGVELLDAEYQELGVKSLGLTTQQVPEEQPTFDVGPLERLKATPELIERLARQLAQINGEDPDARPHPQRYPTWRYYYTRAKTLLAITPAELAALTSLLARNPKPDHAGIDDLKPLQAVQVSGEARQPSSAVELA